MKKGLVIIGVILLVVGLLMMLFLWPMIGTIDGDELTEKLNAQDKLTLTSNYFTLQSQYQKL